MHVNILLENKMVFSLYDTLKPLLFCFFFFKSFVTLDVLAT